MKKLLFIGCVALLVLITIFITLFKNEHNIGNFSISQYEDRINNCSFNVSFGKINNAEEAKKHAETLWIKEYGVEVKKKKPYVVFYDSNVKAWLVQGSLSHETDGGVPNIIINEVDGKVLALWHDK